MNKSLHIFTPVYITLCALYAFALKPKTARPNVKACLGQPSQPNSKQFISILFLALTTLRLANMKSLVIIIIALLTNLTLAHSNPIEGKWETIDDHSGKVRSIVEIYKKGDQYFGKIIEIFTEPDEDSDPVCDECSQDDPRHMQKMIGMEIIKNLIYDNSDDMYEDGNILDPENGCVYNCKLWIENGKLKVRGYILFLYRTQVWYPYAS